MILRFHILMSWIQMEKIEYVTYEDSTAVPSDVALGRIDATLMSSLHIESVKEESGLKN